MTAAHPHTPFQCECPHVGPWSPGGYSAENGLQLCAALKTPLSRPPQISGKFAFKGSKLKKSSGQVSVSKAPNWTKNQFFKTPNLAEVFFFFFFTLWATHTYQKRKLSPPPQVRSFMV